MEKYGQLINPDIKLHRKWFKEMVKLLGIQVVYRCPKKGKKYTTFGEIDTNYEYPIPVGCIFEDHPSQQTMKKLGWMSELDQGSSIIHVDYDLPGLQQGALFTVPSGLDDGKGRLFRVVKMSTIMVYPASITCEIVPEYIDSFNEVTDYGFNSDDMNILGGELIRPTAPMDELDLTLNEG